MFDFHIHSSWSDGVLNEVEILEKIKEKEIKYFSLTDHDNIEGSKRILNHKDFLEENNIKFIIGSELTSIFKGRKTHLLAYGFNPNSDYIIKLLEILKNQRWKQTLYRLEYIAKKFNIKLSEESYRFMKNCSIVNKPLIAACMKNEGYVESKGQAIREYIEKVPDKNFALEPNEIINRIHLAGGKVFLAHPLGEENLGEKFDENEFEKYVDGLIDLNIDGMECYYSAYYNEQIEMLLNYANKNNLFISGGSDFHGVKNKYGEIGKITLQNYPVDEEKLTILKLIK